MSTAGSPSKSFGFPKSVRLRTPYDYRQVAKSPLKFKGSWMCADIRLSSLPPARIGLAVNRRYGSACERNRFKRLLREAFRLSQPHLIGFEAVIRPRTQALTARFQDIQAEFAALLRYVKRHLST